MYRGESERHDEPLKIDFHPSSERSLLRCVVCATRTSLFVRVPQSRTLAPRFYDAFWRITGHFSLASFGALLCLYLLSLTFASDSPSPRRVLLAAPG